MLTGPEWTLRIDIYRVRLNPHRGDIEYLRNPVCRGRGARAHKAGQINPRVFREEHILCDVRIGENDPAGVDEYAASGDRPEAAAARHAQDVHQCTTHCGIDVGE